MDFTIPARLVLNLPEPDSEFNRRDRLGNAEETVYILRVLPTAKLLHSGYFLARKHGIAIGDPNTLISW